MPSRDKHIFTFDFAADGAANAARQLEDMARRAAETEAQLRKIRDELEKNSPQVQRRISNMRQELVGMGVDFQRAVAKITDANLQRRLLDAFTKFPDAEKMKIESPSQMMEALDVQKRIEAEKTRMVEEVGELDNVGIERFFKEFEFRVREFSEMMGEILDPTDIEAFKAQELGKFYERLADRQKEAAVSAFVAQAQMEKAHETALADLRVEQAENLAKIAEEGAKSELDMRMHTETRLQRERLQHYQTVTEMMEGGGVVMAEKVAEAANDWIGAFGALFRGQFVQAGQAFRKAQLSRDAGMAGADRFEGLVGQIGKLVATMAPLIGLIGGLVAFIKWLIDMDAKVKQLAKTMGEGVGAADRFVSGVEGAAKAFRDASTIMAGSFALQMRWAANAEEIAKVTNELSTAGARQIDVFGKFDTAASAADRAMRVFEETTTHAVRFGVSTGDVAKHVGEMVADLGKDFEGVSEALGGIYADAQKSTIATNRFLSAVMSATGQVDLYRQSLHSVSNILADLGKHGAVGAKQAEEITSKITGHFQGMDRNMRATQAALAGRARIMEETQTRIGRLHRDADRAEGAGNIEEARRLRMIAGRMERLREQDDIMSQAQLFGMLDIGQKIGVSVTNALSHMGRDVSGSLREQVEELLGMGLDAAVFGEMTGMDEQTAEGMLLALQALAQREGKLTPEMIAEEWDRRNKQRIDEEAKREAAEWKRRLTPITDLLDIAIQSLLMKIYGGILNVWDAITRLPGFGGSDDERTIRQREIEINQAMLKVDDLQRQKAAAKTPEEKKDLADRIKSEQEGLRSLQEEMTKWKREIADHGQILSERRRGELQSEEMFEAKKAGIIGFKEQALVDGKLDINERNTLVQALGSLMQDARLRTEERDTIIERLNINISGGDPEKVRKAVLQAISEIEQGKRVGGRK